MMNKILVVFILLNITPALADLSPKELAIGKDLYIDDCYSGCHKGDPRDDHVGLVILSRFDLRSIINSCSNHFAPYWTTTERALVIDYLYETYYIKKPVAEKISSPTKLH